jgi:hypothetical protein
VTGRLGWCIALAVRARKYRVAASAAAGVVSVAVLFAAVFSVGFLLAVSHRQKSVADTYTLMAVTGLPFFLATFGLWRLAAALHSRLRSGAAEQSAPAETRATTRSSSRAVAALLAALAFCVGAPVVAAVLFLPVMLLAGPSSAVLPTPLAGVVWLAAIASVFLVPAWLARLVYRRWLPVPTPHPGSRHAERQGSV